MKYVNFLFHIYQPPTQSPEVVDQIVAECYQPLTELFLEFSDLRFTLSITYSLVELLKDRTLRYWRTFARHMRQAPWS